MIDIIHSGSKWIIRFSNNLEAAEISQLSRRPTVDEIGSPRFWTGAAWARARSAALLFASKIEAGMYLSQNRDQLEAENRRSSAK